MSRAVRTVVLLLFVAWTVDYIDRLVINSALLPIRNELHLDHTEQGLVVSVFFMAYAAMQIPSGFLADRFGAVRLAVFGMIAWSVCTGLTAAAWSLASLLAIRCLFGLVQGVFPAAAVKTLAERSRPEERTTANGWVNTANALGVLAAGLIAGALLTSVGWRGMFLAISGLGVLVVLAWLAWMPRPRTELTLTESSLPSRQRPLVWSLLRSPAILCCTAISFGYGGLTWGLTTWVPSYLSEERGVPVNTAALLLIAPTLLAAVTTVVGARLFDRLGGRPRRVVVPAMAVTGVLVVLLPYTNSVVQFMVVVTVLSGTAALCSMASFAMPLRALPARYVGVAAGLIMFGTQLAGILFPYLFGFVVDRYSYAGAFGTLAVGAVIAAVAASLVPQTAEAFRDTLARGKVEVGQ